jgi:hypothetical protein
MHERARVHAGRCRTGTRFDQNIYGKYSMHMHTNMHI